MGRAGATRGAAQGRGARAGNPALPLLQGQCAKVSSINDKNDWKVVRKALTVINFTEDEVEVRRLRGTLSSCHTLKISAHFYSPLLSHTPPPSPCSIRPPLVALMELSAPPVTPLCPCLSPRTY